jgi:hypothetical protein
MTSFVVFSYLQPSVDIEVRMRIIQSHFHPSVDVMITLSYLISPEACYAIQSQLILFRSCRWVQSGAFIHDKV